MIPILLVSLALAETPQPPPPPTNPHSLEPRATGPLTEGAPRIGGGLDAQQLRAGMAPEVDELVACYSRAAAGYSELRGTVRLQISIEADGRTSRVEVERIVLRSGEQEVDHMDFAKCVLFATADAQFAPLSAGERAEASYPLTFLPSP